MIRKLKPWKNCSDKVRFKSKLDAMIQAGKMNKRYQRHIHKGMHRFTVYECPNPQCKGFHLTHTAN